MHPLNLGKQTQPNPTPACKYLSPIRLSADTALTTSPISPPAASHKSPFLAKKTSWQILFHIHLPLLRPATAGALLLIFLETLKELPMTLILRPFNFQTLSTVIYQYASDESLELAAPSVLAVAVLGAAAVSGVLWLEGRNKRGGE